jgi:serine/threonine protein kinase
MATVFAADNIDIGKRVAIKVLAEHLAASQTVVERFLREARAVSKIRSPHICDVYDVGRLEEGTPFLVLELLEGESLYEAMVRDRQMSPPLTLAIVLQLCRGLAKAHEAGIVHRDLKPENVFLTVDDDGNLLVKVLDFGLAKFYDSPAEPEAQARRGKAPPRLTRDGAVFGTPAYMSPEQVRGQAAADTRADLWAVACIAYECVTGTTVWRTDEGVAMTFAQIATAPIPDPRAYRPDLPKSFTAWFQKALDRNLEHRFQTVQQLADELVSAFNYSPKAGGLDAALISQITLAARTMSDLDAPTVLVPRRDVMRHREEQPVPLVRPSRPAPAPRHPDAPGSPRPPKAEHGLAAHHDETPSVPLAKPAPVLPQPTLVHLEAARSSRRRAVVVCGALSVLALGAGLVALGATSDAKVALAQRFGDALARASVAPAGSATLPPVALEHPWFGRVREAQQLLATGEHERAVAVFKQLADDVKHPLPRNLLEQAQLAVAAKRSGAHCQVTGLSRPRTYDVLQTDRRVVPASAPAISRSLGGAVVSWADASEGTERLSAVALDDSLRDAALPAVVSLEANKVGPPRLVPVAQRFVVAYSDSVGVSGAYARWLAPNGVAAGEALLVSSPKSDIVEVDATRSPDGGMVVGWIEAHAPDSTLAFRVYDKAGQPRGEAVRLAQYRAGEGGGRLAHLRIDARGERLFAAYEVVRAAAQEIRLQVVPLDAAPPGLEALGGGPNGGERTLARELLLSRQDEAGADPSIGCNGDGCYVVWHDAAKGGGTVAFLEASTAKVQWTRRVGPSGRRFAVAMAPNGQGQLAWYDGAKLVLAALGLDGAGFESRVAKVALDAPTPSLAPGARRGEWYAAWLDTEGSRTEPYVIRVVCQ